MTNDKIAQQWAQDVADYGKEGAPLMWEVAHKRRDNWVRLYFGMVTPDSEHTLRYYQFRRKPSAALPFDLERARAGDVVEWRNHPKAEWEILDRTGDWWANFIKEIRDPEHFNEVCRMKYPPKVAK